MIARHALGRLHDTYDPRDFLAAEPPSFARLPPSADLRPKCSPVRDQGQQGSCTGFGAAALMEYRQIASGASSYVVTSPAFIYWEERSLERSTPDCDAGAMVRDAMRVLAKTGAASETDAPYSDLRCSEPSAQAKSDAAMLKISSYARVRTLHALRLALSRGQGCLLGFDVYESFESAEVAHDGRVPMPKPGEPLLGGHCTFVAGYFDDAKEPSGGWVLAKNSWGSGWGELGYFYLPYAYVADHKLTSDIWTALA